MPDAVRSIVTDRVSKSICAQRTKTLSLSVVSVYVSVHICLWVCHHNHHIKWKRRTQSQTSVVGIRDITFYYNFINTYNSLAYIQ